MRRLLIILLLALISNHLAADVIFTPYPDNGLIALSFEGIASYELPFSDFNTVNFWGGAGFISSVIRGFPPATGGEIAVEVRQYFNTLTYDKIHFSLYSGLAYMRYPLFYHDRLVNYRSVVGFVPGLKMTWKFRANDWLVTEPYLSISKPLYADDFSHLSKAFGNPEPGLAVTLGVRIGFNKIRKGTK
ncbi:MAG TPA: hypothetical protein VE870_12780 [Bacteroidales bacterium]|nr:hypothetical protein [Bacteroidales bacterium]